MVSLLALDHSVLEGFLLSQDGVLDASVWRSNGTLLASVTLDDTSPTDPGLLRDLCVRTFGSEASPRLVLVQRALRHAA